MEETKLVDISILLEQEITLRRKFALTIKNARGNGGIAIGVNRNCYEILDTSTSEFTLIVIVRKRIGGWVCSQQKFAAFLPLN